MRKHTNKKKKEAVKYRGIKGIVWHFVKEVYSLAGWDLDEKIDNNVMSVQDICKPVY